MRNDEIIVIRGLGKSFAGRPALEGVDLDVRRGEVHGLLGQNGSGKSTLIKILAGVHDPDSGSLLVNGTPVDLPIRPDHTRDLGMSFVHQDLGLVPMMTVMENMRIGRFEHNVWGRVDWRQERQAAQKALQRLDLDVSPDAKVASLSEVNRALVAIARALDGLVSNEQGGLLVLDEPTVYLPRDGIDRLFRAVRRIAELGGGVLFVTHRLEEVGEICNRVTVLRDSRKVGTVETAAVDASQLVEMILGRSLEDLYPEPHLAPGEVRLAVRGLSGAGVHEVSFDLSRGEILGLTGLVGMGFDAVPYLIFGARPAASGELTIDGARLSGSDLTPYTATRHGLALLPANRTRDSGLGSATVCENVTLPVLPSYFRGGRLRQREELRDVTGLLHGFEVNPPDPARRLSTLSGGNQQKALVAKWLQRQPLVLLLHEPTQGVDIGSRKQIFQLIRDTADRGCAVILASAEYEDLAHLCDRVIIFRHGRAVSELRGSTVTRERIVEQCYRSDPPPIAANALRPLAETATNP